MSDAIVILIDIYRRTITYLYTQAQIVPGVSIGWIISAVALTGTIISTLGPRVIRPDIGGKKEDE